MGIPDDGYPRSKPISFIPIATVMVHSHQHIELSGKELEKDGVWEKGPDIQSLLKGIFNGRPDDILFLRTKQPAVSQMGIETGNANAGIGDPRPEECFVTQQDGIQDLFPGDLFGHFS